MISSTTMPRSLAMIGAETMFTSCSIGRSRPAIAAEVSALVFISRDRALIVDLHRLDAALGQLPGERAELFGKRTNGFSRGASSAVIEGMLSALETAPRSR